MSNHSYDLKTPKLKQLINAETEVGLSTTLGYSNKKNPGNCY